MPTQCILQVQPLHTHACMHAHHTHTHTNYHLRTTNRRGLKVDIAQISVGLTLWTGCFACFQCSGFGSRAVLPVDVSLQVAGLCKGGATLPAWKWLLSCVDPQVYLDLVGSREGCSAHFARVSLPTGVTLYVSCQGAERSAGYVAQMAGKQSLP